MKLEKISSEIFTTFESAKISNLHKLFGGASDVTTRGRKNLNGGSCTMSWTSDTTDGNTTTYHGTSYSGSDCPE